MCHEVMYVGTMTNLVGRSIPLVRSATYSSLYCTLIYAVQAYYDAYQMHGRSGWEMLRNLPREIMPGRGDNRRLTSQISAFCQNEQSAMKAFVKKVFKSSLLVSFISKLLSSSDKDG